MTTTTRSGTFAGLEMEFDVAPDGRTVLSHLFRRVPMIVQQALYFDENVPTMACVYILSSGGPYLEDDRYTVDVLLRKGAMAHISTGAATIVAPMHTGSAHMHQHITLQQGSYLEWMPKAIIPARSSSYEAVTEIQVDPTATLLFMEIVACGRLHHGERFDYTSLRLHTSFSHPKGPTLLRDVVSLLPLRRKPSEWGMMGNFSHFGSVVLIAPPADTDTLYEELTPRMEHNLRLSVARLRDSCGLSMRLLGQSEQQIMGEMRTIASMVRRRIKGVEMPEEFAWR